jgi:hypothetical protein
MQKILFLVILVLLAFPAIVTSPVSVAHASHGPAFFEAVYDNVRVVVTVDHEEKCVCSKSGLCGPQQVVGLCDWRGVIDEFSRSSGMRPVLCSSALKSHITELEPPPPRSFLCCTTQS